MIAQAIRQLVTDFPGARIELIMGDAPTQRGNGAADLGVGAISAKASTAILQAFAWPELDGINLDQKLMDNLRCGRERIGLDLSRIGHNSLTPISMARLIEPADLRVSRYRQRSAYPRSRQPTAHPRRLSVARLSRRGPVQGDANLVEGRP